MEWYNGPGLVAWLETQGIHPTKSEAGSRLADVLRNWRSGQRVTLWSADRVLIELGLHIGMVPDEVLVEKPQNRVNGQGRVKRLPVRETLPVSVATLFRAFDRRVPDSVLAQQYKVSREMIRHYKEEWVNGSDADDGGRSSHSDLGMGGAEAVSR